MSFLLSSIKETKVVDPMTVQFTLTEPFAPLLTNLAGVSASIVSPTAVAKYGKDFGRNPVGTGAFKFNEWTANQHVTVDANPNYWDGAPKLAQVVFRPITDANTRVAEMLSGGLDVMLETPPDSLSQFANNDSYKVVTATGPHTWFLILNLKNDLLKDKRVRQALNYAINKDAIDNDVLQGTADASGGPIPAAFGPSHDIGVTPYPYDPDKAKALLKEAGAEGKSLTFYVTQGGSGMLDPVPMGTAIQADLKAVGLDVKIQTFEWNTFLSKVNAGLDKQADMAEMAWMTSDPDTLPFLTLRTAAWPDKGGFNSGYYSNPDVDKLLDQARKSTSPEERAGLYKQVDKIVHDDAPWVFVSSWKQNAVTTAAVKNFALQPDFDLVLHNVTKQ
jgi:peptide/nickel transport system substrate-binding protein